MYGRKFVAQRGSWFPDTSFCARLSARLKDVLRTGEVILGSSQNLSVCSFVEKTGNIRFFFGHRTFSSQHPAV